DGKPSTEAAADLLATMREGSPEDASNKVVELLAAGVAPQSIWDGLLAGAGELLMRQPGTVGLHTLTTTNALLYAYQASGSDETRRWLMLQNAAFLPMFREVMRGRGRVQDGRIDQLEPEPIKATGAEAVTEIFAEVSRNRTLAARKVL